MAQAGVILGWVALALSAIGVVCFLLIFGGTIGLGLCSALFQFQSSQFLLQALASLR